VAAAVLAELRGADFITVHLREDRRHIQGEHVTFAKEYLYSSLKTLYLRAFNHFIAKALKLCTFKSDMLPTPSRPKDSSLTEF